MKTGTVARLVATLAAVAIAATLVGCNAGTDSADENGVDPVAGDPVAGGTLRYAIAAELPSLDPAHQGGSIGASGGAQPMFAIYDSLLWVNAETGEPEPRLASSLETGGSNADWVLTLREDLVFSDGTPFDAEAVKFNWERFKDPEVQASNAPSASRIESLEALDPTTLQITLSEPDRDFDFTVATRLGFIASPTAIQSGGERFGEEPVGAGPFLLTDWVRDSYKEFERNPKYFDAPRPYVDAMRIDVILDGTQLRNTMLANQADMVYSLSISEFQPLEEAGLESLRVLTPGSPNMILNNAAAPFDDADVRRALALAIDHEQMADNTRAFEYLAGPFPDGSPFNFGLTWPAYDPEAAQEIFDAYAERTGGPLTFTILGFNDPANRMWSTYLQSAFNSYDNVEVEVEVGELNATITKIYTGAYEAATWGSLYLTPAELRFYLVSDAQNNVMNYSDPEVDAAFDALAAAESDAEAEEHSRFIVEKLVTDNPFLNIGARASTNIFGPRVNGLTVHDDGVPDFSQIWLSQE